LALVLTLRGTPFLYNGEEIGMTDLPLASAALFRDSMGIWFHRALIEELRAPPEQALDLARRYGRDKCRTPMQWADAPNAGFSPAGVQTWLPVNPNYAQGVNVAEQTGDPDSLLTFYRRMLRVRKGTPALIAGEYTPLRGESEGFIAFLRSSEADGQTCLVVLNMDNQARTLSFDLDAQTARPLFSSHPRGSDTDDLSQLPIAPFEVYVAEVGTEDGVPFQPSSRQGDAARRR
jgi:alpha-glucosidase